MPVYQATLSFRTKGQGTSEITEAVSREVAGSGVARGLVSIFCQHTSCSLVIMENADPTARRDLERWLDRLVPEADADFVHTLEGPDDMPSHIKMALTRTSETVPIEGGRLLLGTWQGIFLWEHRRAPHTRQVIVTVMGE
jgi:secondary thiamine-phosphate synthase enzyme